MAAKLISTSATTSGSLTSNSTAAHNITTGKVYRTVIDKERRGDFLGETVQIIPHITDQIKTCIRQAAEEEFPDGTKADICLVEVGGTVGDIESMPFLEAVRQMHGELPEHDIVLIHVTLIPEDTMGDMKTKPTQHSVKALRELGSPCRHHCRQEREPDRCRHKTQDLRILRSPPECGHLCSNRPGYLCSPDGDGKGRHCRCALRPSRAR